MKLSTETLVMRNRFDAETAVRMIHEAGFDAYDYSQHGMSGERDALRDDYRERAKKLRAYADSLGISCNQSHAPFDFLRTNVTDLSDPVYLRLIRSIEAASILGAKNIIIHCVTDGFESNEELLEYNRNYYRTFIPYCEEFGIHVSVENIFYRKEQKFVPVLCNPLEHQDFVASLGSDCFNICSDIGHYTITGYQPEDNIRKMNRKILRAVHIHDNDYRSDGHLMPCTGKMNWENITDSFAEIGYDGDFTLEDFGGIAKLDSSLLAAGLKFSEQVGRFLIRRIQEKTVAR